MIVLQSLMSRFAQGADMALNRMLALNSPVRDELMAEERNYGYFCVADLQGLPLAISYIGQLNPDEEKRMRRFVLCQEKVIRLSQFPSHRRSFESRDPDSYQYGGGLRGELYLASFSGLPESHDEICAGAALVAASDIRFDVLVQVLAENRLVLEHGSDWLFNTVRV